MTSNATRASASPPAYAAPRREEAKRLTHMMHVRTRVDRKSRALLAALVVAAAFGCGRGDARRRAIEVGWREGARYVYTARVTSHAGLGGQSPFDLELAAG